MGEGRNELEFDEFEKLLFEIPHATYGNPQFENAELNRMVLDDYNLSPIRKNSWRGSFQEKSTKSNGSLSQENPNMIRQSSIKRALPAEINLPNNQSLMSAFAGLRFKDGLTQTQCPMLNNISSPNKPLFLGNHYTTTTAKKSSSDKDSRVMVVPTLPSPNDVPFTYDEFGITKAGQENSDVSKHNVIGLKNRHAEHCHPIESFSAAVQLANGGKGHFLSNTPVASVEFPVMSNQPQFFTGTQAPVPYLHTREFNQPQICWRSMEEEYNGIHRQHLYAQQLHNHWLETWQNPTNGNIETRTTSQKTRQPCLEMPISNQSEQELMWNNHVVTKGSIQPNHLHSATGFNTVGDREKMAKYTYPENLLTRSHGLKNSGEGKETVFNVSPNGKVLSNGHFHFQQNLSTPTAKSFQLVSLSSCHIPTDMLDLKSIDMMSLSQKGQSVDEATGRIILMAKDQHGCRFLQRKFSEGNTKVVESIFVEIVDHIVELMTDPFGNYLVQKLLEVCDENQRMQILYAITKDTGELVRISCDMHGTRAVQKVIETLKGPEQFSLVVASLGSGIVTLMKDTNGNHVVQRCLQYLMPENTEFIFEAATTNCVELATDCHGCCVLQKCLNYSTGEKRRRLIYEITSSALILSQDPYGNYVVQFVFELQLPWATTDILAQLDDNYGDLSMQKYSSNVVEKCLTSAGEVHCTRIIQELINNPRLDQIMQDPYGNYVIQAALKQSKGSLRAVLVDAVRPHIPVLRTSPYGKKVLSRNRLKK